MSEKSQIIQERAMPKNHIRKERRIEKLAGLIFLNPVSKLFLPARMKTDNNSKLRDAYFGYRKEALRELLGDRLYKSLYNLL